MHGARVSIETPGRGLFDITERVAAVVEESGVRLGLCNVFILHTSASLLITEVLKPLYICA